MPLDIDALLAGTHTKTQSYDSDSWFTDPQFIAVVHRFYGTIDIDPASCKVANSVVKATKYYTKKDNGLIKPWYGKVWVNPPFSTGNIDAFAKKTIDELSNCDEILFLCQSKNDTRWYQSLMQHTDLMLLVKGRPKFWGNPINNSDRPRYPTTLFYFGHRTSEFIKTFKPLGTIVKPQREETTKAVYTEQFLLKLSNRQITKLKLIALKLGERPTDVLRKMINDNPLVSDEEVIREMGMET